MQLITELNNIDMPVIGEAVTDIVVEAFSDVDNEVDFELKMGINGDVVIAEETLVVSELLESLIVVSLVVADLRVVNATVVAF